MLFWYPRIPYYSGASISRSRWGPAKIVRYIENLDVTNLRGNDQKVRYIEVIVNDWIITQVTSVEILLCQCLPHIISHWLKGCCLSTIRIKGCVDGWSVQRLSSAACWHCNSLYRGKFYIWASGLCSLYRRIRYIEVCFIEVLFHTFTVTLAEM